MKQLTNKLFGRIIVVLGLTGLAASLILSYEKYSVALNPDHIPSCSLSPFIDCAQVMSSGADSLVLGVPNPFFGLALFGALTAVGVSIIAGAKFKAWFWKMFLAVAAAGFLAVIFFFYQSLYVIEALCLYCMVVWLAVIALLFYTKLWMAGQGLLKVPSFATKIWTIISRNHLAVILLIYFLIYMAVAIKFNDLSWIRFLWIGK